jgi:hypothetical protein
MRVVRGSMVSAGLVVVGFLDVEWFGSEMLLRTRRCAGVSPPTSPPSRGWPGRGCLTDQLSRLARQLVT